MPRLSQKQLFIVGGGIFVLLGIILLIFLNDRGSSQPSRVQLTFWGTENRNDISKLLDGYKSLRPNVQIEYKQFNPGQFEESLLNALASGEGPDVLMLANRTLPRQKSKLVSAPASVFSATQLRQLFPSVAEQDFVSNGEIFGLPLYIDTLALLYNRSLLDQASLVAPPRTWEDFQKVIPYLRKLNENGQLVRPAAGIGGSNRSVPYATDILATLLMQNGVDIQNGFQGVTTEKGIQAFQYYLQFANTASNYYTWNDNQPSALEAFRNGNAAMAFGYYADVLKLKQESPFLDFGVAPMPQVGGQAKSHPRYLGLAVSRQSKNSDWAWDFVVSATTNSEILVPYLKATSHPPALRNLIGLNLNDPSWGVFVSQALTARSWYAADERLAESALNEAILNVLTGQRDFTQALGQARSKIGENRPK